MKKILLMDLRNKEVHIVFGVLSVVFLVLSFIFPNIFTLSYLSYFVAAIPIYIYFKNDSNGVYYYMRYAPIKENNIYHAKFLMGLVYSMAVYAIKTIGQLIIAVCTSEYEAMFDAVLVQNGGFAIAIITVAVSLFLMIDTLTSVDFLVVEFFLIFSVVALIEGFSYPYPMFKNIAIAIVSAISLPVYGLVWWACTKE